jgi:hypothetical protein
MGGSEAILGLFAVLVGGIVVVVVYSWLLDQVLASLAPAASCLVAPAACSAVALAKTEELITWTWILLGFGICLGVGSLIAMSAGSWTHSTKSGGRDHRYKNNTFNHAVEGDWPMVGLAGAGGCGIPLFIVSVMGLFDHGPWQNGPGWALVLGLLVFGIFGLFALAAVEDSVRAIPDHPGRAIGLFLTAALAAAILIFSIVSLEASDREAARGQRCSDLTEKAEKAAETGTLQDSLTELEAIRKQSSECKLSPLQGIGPGILRKASGASLGEIEAAASTLEFLIQTQDCLSDYGLTREEVEEALRGIQRKRIVDELEEAMASAKSDPVSALRSVCGLADPAGNAGVGEFEGALAQTRQSVCSGVKKGGDQLLRLVRKRSFTRWMKLAEGDGSNGDQGREEFIRRKKAWLKENRDLDPGRARLGEAECTFETCAERVRLTWSAARKRGQNGGSVPGPERVLAATFCHESGGGEWRLCRDLEVIQP